MNKLGNYTDEEFRTLTREQIINMMNDEKYEEDVIALDELVKDRGNWKRDPNAYYRQIITTLQKHPNKIFYICYEHQDPHYGNNIIKLRIYSEHSIGNIVPTGIDLNKLYFSGGEKPYNYIKYPFYYGMASSNTIGCISQLATEHKNLRFIHPELLQYGIMFVHFYLKN